MAQTPPSVDVAVVIVVKVWRYDAFSAFAIEVLEGERTTHLCTLGHGDCGEGLWERQA